MSLAVIVGVSGALLARYGRRWQSYTTCADVAREAVKARQKVKPRKRKVGVR